MTSPPRRRRLPLATGLTASLLEWGTDRPELDHTVVLVHGFLDIAASFIACARAGLAEHFHLVAPDVRGHGDSDRVGPGGYYHFMDYVADLASVIAQTARARVSLVGHSMGGSIAAYYAGAFPERVHRLALLEGLGPPEDDPLLPERVARWIAAWERARQATPGAYDDIAAAARRLQSVDPLLDHALALELAEAGTRALDDGRRIFKHDPVHLTRGPYPFRLEVAESFWRSVACPVLIVEGETSPFRQLQGLDRRIACFADVRREVIPGAAHMLQRHQPERLAELLIEHLSDATPAQGKAP